jgi:hypothetical protein
MGAITLKGRHSKGRAIIDVEAEGVTGTQDIKE